MDPEVIGHATTTSDNMVIILYHIYSVSQKKIPPSTIF